MRKGPRASGPFERVYVDLCGSMVVTSLLGCVYAMNIINNFSSYVWCIPLKKKDGAAAALQAWHRLVHTQSGPTLKILVTDNGELLFNKTTNWCVSLGIDHLLTTPYTSAHNGRAKCIHHTICYDFSFLSLISLLIP